MSAQPSLLDALPDLLPIVPGCIEGIVSLSPFIVQCPRCGDCYTGVPVLAASAVPFWDHGNPTRSPRRQCRDCWADDGWALSDHGGSVRGEDPELARQILERTHPHRHRDRITPAEARRLIATTREEPTDD